MMIKLSVQNTRNFERFYNLLMQHVSEMLTIFVPIKIVTVHLNPKNWSNKPCSRESWSVVGNKARCKDMLHVEIKLLKLQEVNHAVHMDPGKSTCGASCKNSSYQMPLNYCILALQPAGTKLEQHVYS